MTTEERAQCGRMFEAVYAAIDEHCDVEELREIRFRWDEDDLVAVAYDGCSVACFLARDYTDGHIEVNQLWLTDIMREMVTDICK